MKIYIDTDFKCHAANPDGIYREIDMYFFEGKCDAFIEGYRYIPFGESWKRPDGEIFNGEMVAPWKDFAQLDAAQRQYERDLIYDMETALCTMGVRLSV